jgi:CheY-like chemotaxis protein
MSPTPLVLGLIPDLLTSVRVESAVQRLGGRVRIVENDLEFVQELSSNAPVLAILDLGHHWMDVMFLVDACRKARVPVLAFGPHADMGRQRDARQAGAEFVYPRSKFMADTTGCLRDALAGSRAQLA